MSEVPPRRRDLLTTIAFTTAGVGGLFALWPLVAALGPDQETLARRKTFNTLDLVGSERKFVDVHTRAVAIFRRTEAELAHLRSAFSFNTLKLRDRDSNKSTQPDWAKNWHRSLRPDIMVFDARCTLDGCVVSEFQRADFTLLCPCCGSLYDLAGRVFGGPAPRNLPVPPHRFITGTTIEFTVGDVAAMPA